MWNLPDAHAGTPDPASNISQIDPLPATSQRIPASPIPSRLIFANQTPVSPIPYHTAPHRQLSGLIAYRFPSLRHPSPLALSFFNLPASSYFFIFSSPAASSPSITSSLSLSFLQSGIDWCWSIQSVRLYTTNADWHLKVGRSLGGIVVVTFSLSYHILLLAGISIGI